MLYSHGPWNLGIAGRAGACSPIALNPKPEGRRVLKSVGRSFKSGRVLKLFRMPYIAGRQFLNAHVMVRRHVRAGLSITRPFMGMHLPWPLDPGRWIV